MGTRFQFYTYQALKNIKKSIMVLMGLSLALSMVAGMNFFNDSYQNFSLSSNFNNINDMQIVYPYQIDLPTALIEDDDEISELLTTQFPDIMSIHYFGRCDLSSFNLYQNYSSSPLDISGNKFKYVGSYSNFFFFDEDFYSSARFKQYFELIEGRFPQTENVRRWPLFCIISGANKR
jgi:hypothetical protein